MSWLSAAAVDSAELQIFKSLSFRARQKQRRREDLPGCSECVPKAMEGSSLQHIPLGLQQSQKLEVEMKNTANQKHLRAMEIIPYGLLFSPDYI